MDKYICDVCGYIYDPAVGDPDGGIEPGTAFEDIPEDWVCTVCGRGRPFLGAPAFRFGNGKTEHPAKGYRSLLEHRSRMPATSEQKISVHTPKATVLALVPL